MPRTTRKTIYFDYFQCGIMSSNPNLPQIALDTIFSRFQNKHDSEGQNTVRQIAGKAMELRHLVPTDFGYKGIIGKYRVADLPHAAVPGGAERELDLDEDELLIEKSYFHYYSDRSLLIIQRNRFAVNHSLFSNYLSVDGYTVSLNSILEPADLQRLMSNQANIRVANLTIARPTNPDLFHDIQHDFNNSIIQSLNSSKAASVNLLLRGDGHSNNPEKRYLDNGLKRAFLELKDRFNVKKAEILLEENGVPHPIDLIADRITYHTGIEIAGRYPNAEDMWAALREARDQKEADLANYFGVLGQDILN